MGLLILHQREWAAIWSYPNDLTKWQDLINEKLSFRWSAFPVMLSWTLPQSAIVDRGA